jgi:integrase
LKRRRSQGEGSVFKRKDGRWVGRLDVGYEGGKRKRREYYGRTEAEALRRLAEARRASEDGLPLPDERKRLDQFLVGWLGDVARHSVRPSTYKRYRELVELHVLSEIGRLPLRKLTPAALQSLYARKLDAGLSPTTVGHIHRVLHRALGDALRWGLVVRNPCAAVRPPRVPVNEMRALSVGDAQRLLASLEGEPLQALYVLAITAGLRQGELLGLKWSDIDLGRGRLQVQRTVRRIDGELVESEPKSRKSRRTVILTARATAALRAHRARQVEERVRAVAWFDLDLVFPNNIGTHMDDGNLRRRSFQPLIERAEVPRVRFHDLRHTAATLLMIQGVHPRVVQEMLGHSSVNVTLDTYSHVSEDLQRDAAAKMDALFASGP